MQNEINKLLELYLSQHNILYEHLFSSFHQFVDEIIPYVLNEEMNYFYETIEKDIIYLHGFKCTNIRIKPVVFDNDNDIKFPSDARKNYLNYFANVIADIEQYVEQINTYTNEKTVKVVYPIEYNLPVANIPIMVKSKYCSTQIKQDLKGECKYDPGGYFIVNGQEKVIMSIEKMVDNKILVYAKKDTTYPSGLIYTAQVSSKKNDWSENLQILTVKPKKDNSLVLSTSSRLVDIPIVILLRALGIESDKQIMSYLTFDLNDIKMINLLRSSFINAIDDNGNVIKTKNEAIEYLITRLKKNKRISQTNIEVANIQKRFYLEKIFKQDLLPHLEDDINKKIVFIGLIVNKLLNVIIGRLELDDRDALQNKRIETPGVLLGQLFKQNWKKLLNEIGKHFKKKNHSDENPINVINQIKPTVIEQGLKTALSKGVWGLNKTKKGVAQSLQRLSWIQGISALRRILSPSKDESTSKVTSMRQVSPNQCQLLCCLVDKTEIVLGNMYDIKTIKDIVNYDEVSTLNLQNYKFEKSHIYNKFEYYSKDILQIVLESGRTINGTLDHKLLIVNKDGEHWKQLQDIKLTDNLVVVPGIQIYYCENIILDYITLNPIQFLINNNLHILARLYGFFYNKDIVSFKHSIDCEQFINDLQEFNVKCKQCLEDEEYIIINQNEQYYIFSEYINSFKYKSEIPDWILTNSKLVKREFLSGYFGSFDSHIEINNMFTDIITDTNILKLLYEFDIIIYEHKILYTYNNIIKYNDCIGFRYNQYKSYSLGLISEYYKIIRNTSKCLEYTDFLTEYLYNGLLIVPIIEILKCESTIVYDFTTMSDNHNFIANSVISSNCAETPESNKIGLVKSLAMTATITIQNSTQYMIIKLLLDKNTHTKHPFDVDPLIYNQYVKIFINGNLTKICKIKYSYELYLQLKKARFDNIIDKYTTILFDFDFKEIKIYSDGGRLIRPLLVVNDNKINITPEIINFVNKEINSIRKYNLWNTLMQKYNNLVEYEDIESLNYLMVAEYYYKLEESITAKNKKVENISLDKLNRYGEFKWINYTHCDFHPWTMLGNVSCSIPFSNHNYGVRNILLFSQAKQAMGIYLSSYKDRIDISQILYHPQVPLVQTQGMKYNGCLDLPYGENVIIAICSYNGYNQEDSLILNQSAIDRGIFRADTLKKYHSEIKKNPSTSQDDIFTKPDRTKVIGLKHGNYNKLNEKGYVPEEIAVENEDIIIGKISPIRPTSNNKVYKDNSEIYKGNVQGVIDRIHTGIYNTEGYEMYNVKVRLERKPVIGDKFSCYDDTHEILTNKGWVNIKHITINHLVATLVDDKIVYQNPIKIQSYNYSGLMYCVDTSTVSLCVTPNHRMYVRTSNNQKYTIENAEHIYNKKRYFKNDAESVVINEKDTKNFIYSNDENDSNKISHFKINDLIFNIIDWLYFYGMFISIGYLPVVDNSTIIFYNINNTFIKLVLLNFVKKYNLTYEMINYRVLVITSDILYSYLYKISKNKFLPSWVWNLSTSNCISLIQGITANFNILYFKTLSRHLANDLQRLYLHGGYSITTSNMKLENYPEFTYIKLLINFKEPCVYQQDKLVRFVGKVYCCTVSLGLGLLYVRRNFIPVWSGNSLHGQKATVGIVYKQKDMPFTESGIVPDIIYNPHGFPSRMSLGQFIECLASKQAAITGKFVDGTPFNNYDVMEIPKLLKTLGYSPYGTETMYCGITGRKMDAEIFIGPSYNIRLKHLVLEKVHGRARGPKQALTRQPLEGRTRDGGLKIGEMEKDAIVAHGISQFLKERLMETSDILKIHVCDDCGMFVSKVIDKEYYRCKGCKNSTRISAVVIPYACKLLFQELTSVNILPRIRTEKSIYGDEI